MAIESTAMSDLPIPPGEYLAEVIGELGMNQAELAQRMGRPVQAISEIMQTIGYGSSNYGNSFADFEDGWMSFVNNKTTVIILGDGRGNRTDPRTDVIGRLSQRSKRIIWLNPEYKSAWGTGDSDMFRYAPFCNLVTVCNTLRQLERVIADILEDAA